MITHLKDRSYYEDSYDRNTVDECLRMEGAFEGKMSGFAEVALYFIKGDRYVKRSENIEKWMAEDRKRDEMLRTTPFPEALCILCEDDMKFVDKSLHYSFEPPSEDVEFFFQCEPCKVGCTIIGERRKEHIPWQCPKCKKRLESKSVKGKTSIKTKKHCTHCGFKDEYTYDFQVPKPKPNRNLVKRFNENKLRFWLSEEKGRQYRSGLVARENLERIVKRQAEVKAPKPKIKMLSAKEVQDSLLKILNELELENGSVSYPDSNKGISLKFKALDPKPRKLSELKKSIKKKSAELLNGTNWKIVMSSFEYELGLLSFRMNGKTEREVLWDNVIL